MGRVLKAVALYSGGLDSILAIKLMLDQDCQVYALGFQTPFFSTRDDLSLLVAVHPDLRLNIMDITQGFLKVLASPGYGYGKCMNPCIDCKILMLCEAKSYMEKVKADFVFTGEVLGQRPMSQRRDTLRLLEKESGLEGILLRPLSAKLLPPTRMEKAGLIDTNRLLDLSGRSRKRQIAMAQALNLQGYPTPAGGCLLTDPCFANRLKILMDKGKLDPEVIKWLKIGRHFELSMGIRVVVGRNQKENELILKMAGNDDLLIKTLSVPGPVAVVLGHTSKETERVAASIIAGYSDTPRGCEVEVALGKRGGFWDQFLVSPMSRKDIEVYKI